MEVPPQNVGDSPTTGIGDGRREELFRLRNRLAREPGDLGLIEEYVDLVLASTSQEQGAEMVETCDRLESFLLERAGDVEPDEVDALLDIASDLDKRREEALRQSKPDVQTSETDQKVIDTLEDWRENGIDTTIPKGPEKTEQKLSLCKAIRAYTRDRGEAPLDGLESLIDRLQAASQADESISRAEQMIETAEEESNHSKATYILQSAEQAVQQLVMARTDLGSARRGRIQEVIQELESISGSLTKARRSEEDRRRRENLLEAHGEDLEEFESWDPEEGGRFKDKFQSVADGDDGGKKLSISKTGKEPAENVLTDKIGRLEALIQVLSRAADEMRTPSGQEMIEDKIEGLSETLETTRRKRQQVYNEFALARIRKCFSKAEDATGTTWNDKEEIADQLVKYLAEVDQRFLTSEVSRCYSEVFEHLYGKLNRAKSEDDFKEEGRKLNALKRMKETETIGIEEF